MTSRLERAVGTVVRNDNCSGCGGCALLSDRISVSLSGEGFLRPTVAATPTPPQEDRAEARLFNRVCPGSRLVAPADPRPRDSRTFGPYVEAWEAWATDPEVRNAGSSAGVLTALTTWLVESGRAPGVTGAASDDTHPSRTVPVRITTRAEALASSGSRYAPVGTVSRYSAQARGDALVGKPCEVSAARQLNEALGIPAELAPIRLTFFCAGTPSQRATDKLSASLGVEADDAISLRYRGNGWPGEFTVVGSDGTVGRTSYDDSWGKHLGRDLQWRCKICPDGTGADGDVSVGDYWRADEAGYPIFEDAEGSSVVIARTRRGLALVEAAIAEGVITASPIALEGVAAIQPLQRERRRTLLGRLLGRVSAGKKIPHFRGYGLVTLARSDTTGNIRAARGTFRRSRRA
jgi:coenzyme F420 hydrogenase subunit beta